MLIFKISPQVHSSLMCSQESQDYAEAILALTKVHGWVHCGDSQEGQYHHPTEPRAICVPNVSSRMLTWEP